MRRSMVQPSDWSGLPVDIIDIISGKVLEDDWLQYVRFRGVCSSWRRFMAAPNCLDGRFRLKDWVLKMEGVAEVGTEWHAYVNIRDGRVLKTGNILDLIIPNYTILAIADGLFVVMHNDTTRVGFLSPITRCFTDGLPPLSTCVPMFQARNDLADLQYLRSVLLSVCFAASTVVIHFRDSPVVAFAKSGDRRWYRTREHVEMHSMASFQDELYGVSRHGKVFKFVPATDVQSFPILAHIVSIPNGERYPYHILVESAGKLLVATMSIALRNHPCNDLLHLTALIREVEVQNMNLLLPVTNLRGNALFLCCNKALSLPCTLLPSIQNSFSHNFMCFIQNRRRPVRTFYMARRDQYTVMAPNRFPMREISHPWAPVRPPFSIIDQMIFYCRGF